MSARAEPVEAPADPAERTWDREGEIEQESTMAAPEQRSDEQVASARTSSTDASDAAVSTGDEPGRATPADAPDVPGQTTMLPIGDADLPETGVGTVGEGAGTREDGVTSPAAPTNEQLEPSGFDTASSDASPDLTR